MHNDRKLVREITPFPPGILSFCKELTSYRQLLKFFIWRDIVVRYKQTLLGIAWVIIKPLLTMLLFSFIFGVVARFSSEEVSYPLFVLSGMLPWQYFSNCAVDSCSSLINNGSLITKSYFPRILLPMSLVTAQAIDFFVNCAVFIVLALFLGGFSLQNFIMFPLLAIWTYLFCLGSGIWLASLTVRYRDIKFLITFLIQFGMFLSPVGYGTFLIPKIWIPIYALNPMVGLIDAYRWVFLGISHSDLFLTCTISLVLTLLICLGGIFSIKKTEASLMDLL